jgi:RNA polymerase sigma factor (sigma-70 family)
MTDDAALLRCYAEERSEEAFAEFVQRHLGLVYAAALRRTSGDEHRASEVAQQVFTTVARRAAVLARHDSLTGWLYTATRNAALNLRRDERRRRIREHAAQTMIELLTASAPEVDWDRLRPVLDAAMDELNDRDREVVLLRFFEGRAFAEVGTKLRLTENAARMRVDRALDKLRGLLAKRGVTSTAAALAVVLTNQTGVAVPAGLAATVTGAALAGAAATGGAAGLGAFLGFMSTSKITSGLVAAAFLATAVAVYEVSASRDAGKALATAQREHDTLVARVRGAERSAKEAEVRRATEQGSPDAARAAGAPPTVTPAASAPADPLEVGRAFLLAHPEIKPLLVDAAKARIAGGYFPFYRELGLSESAIARFEEIMISGVKGRYTNFAGIGAMTLETAPTLSDAEKDERLRQLLGESGFRRLEEYQKAQDSNYANRLASALYFTDTPLTAEQGVQLGRMVAEVRSREPWGTTPPQVFWAQIRDRTSAFLAASQRAALEGLQASDDVLWASRHRNGQ